MNDEHLTNHLGMIQTIIGRLAENSFAIKGWSITLVSALFALAAQDANERYAALALLPALSFWGLDAHYLRQERIFRCLFEHVRRPAAGGAPAIAAYAMDTTSVEAQVESWGATLLSKSIFWLHAPILGAVVVVTIYSATKS